MSEALTILMAQINPTVGAIEANADKIIQIIEENQATHDLIIFPELVLTGYPPEDLLLRPRLFSRCEQTLKRICKGVKATNVVIGHPIQKEDACYNALSLIHQGKILHTYKKQHLPNTGVFDEKRYFEPGPTDVFTLTIQGQTLGFCICEDIWNPGPVENLMKANSKILVCINASPFEIDKFESRLNLLKPHAPHHLSLVYVNLVGGQDELVFDGQSFVTNLQGEIKARAHAFKEDLLTVTFDAEDIHGEIRDNLTDEALLYEALKTGLKGYVHKNGFSGVLLGLSGGIDSALTLALAVDALGKDNVHPIMLPSRYTAEISNTDALEMINALGVTHNNISIEQGFEAMLDTLTPHLPDKTMPDITAQNLQARLRGMILMAYSNATGKLVLSTSNKSESAVGYTTLYGDMCGGFAPIKDVPKTHVYKLAEYRNTVSPVIPERIITRAPSAELAHGQTDQDTLPDYPELDAIISYYMHEKLSIYDIIDKGYDEKAVKQVIRLIKQNEYKRRQAPPGTKVTKRAFGRDWRYPITSKY